MILTKIDKTYNEQLHAMYRALPVRDYLKVREDLMKELEWTKDTFYARLAGRSLIRGLEIPLIKAVFARYGYEIFND